MPIIHKFLPGSYRYPAFVFFVFGNRTFFVLTLPHCAEKNRGDPGPILENLKTDSSLYVRRSVANNLNDISKTHPDLVMDLAEKWYGKNDSTDWILRPTAVSIGEDILFSFTVLAESDIKARIEYGIDYVKASGKRTRKLFKLSEITLKEKEKRFYRKKHSFKNLSTRKHYPGIHTLTLIINGRECGKADFELYDYV